PLYSSLDVSRNRTPSPPSAQDRRKTRHFPQSQPGTPVALTTVGSPRGGSGVLLVRTGWKLSPLRSSRHGRSVRALCRGARWHRVCGAVRRIVAPLYAAGRPGAATARRRLERPARPERVKRTRRVYFMPILNRTEPFAKLIRNV